MTNVPVRTLVTQKPATVQEQVFSTELISRVRNGRAMLCLQFSNAQFAMVHMQMPPAKI